MWIGEWGGGGVDCWGLRGVGWVIRWLGGGLWAKETEFRAKLGTCVIIHVNASPRHWREGKNHMRDSLSGDATKICRELPTFQRLSLLLPRHHIFRLPSPPTPQQAVWPLAIRPPPTSPQHLYPPHTRTSHKHTDSSRHVRIGNKTLSEEKLKISYTNDARPTV